MRIYLVSTSARKRAQFVQLMAGGGEIELVDPGDHLYEPQTTDIVEVARHKLLDAAGRVPQRPLMVDDVGLLIPALGGFPGALLKPMLESGGTGLLEKVTRGLRDGARIAAEYLCVLAVAVDDDNGGRVIEATGTMTGELDFSDASLLTERDTARMFYPDGGGRSLHEIAEEQGPTAYRHRATAVDRIIAQLATPRPAALAGTREQRGAGRVSPNGAPRREPRSQE